jgi:glycosyltransferase involved in cell wall biosynthesis
MKIVFFAHPLFLGSQSMPRFVGMLADGMKSRGYEVEVWRPEALFSAKINSFKKWMGYIDQYVVFPQQVKRRLKDDNGEVLYVVTDHALGPYVPLIADRPHVIHCHDFLAQRSALGEIPENMTSATGRAYQSYIKKGYSKGKNFISVSEKTRKDLGSFLKEVPKRSEMVYNGINTAFQPQEVEASRNLLSEKLDLALNEGYILHVGGNQWYKNRVGVIEIYDAWRAKYGKQLPLLLVGQQPNASLKLKYEASPYKNDIHFLKNITDEEVKMAYSGASAFLFPSIAEGFGWPIAEAMASATVVVTTNAAPMLEVAGDAAFLIGRKPSVKAEQQQWAEDAAEVLDRALSLTAEQREEWINKGRENVARFKLDDALDQIEKIYSSVYINDKTKISL